MSEIHVNVTDQLLKVVTAPTLASGGINEVKVVFNFCTKWEGFIKTAIFYRDTEKVYYAVLDENDTCILPWEVYAEDGTFYISVFGEKDDIRRTSTIVRYKVGKGIVAEELMPSEPTPEVYDQIIQMYQDIRALIQSGGGGGSAGAAVLYTEQNLTGTQKAQARENIGAADAEELRREKENIINKCCPTVTESDSVVTFESIEGYPLGVVSKIVPKQEGSGDPSFDNIRPISGHTAVNLNRNDDVFTIDFGQTVYGGNFDWNNGVLTIDRKMITLDGTEVWTAHATGKTGIKRYRLTRQNNTTLLANIKLRGEQSSIVDDNLLCSKLPTHSGDWGWMAKSDCIYAEGTASINCVHTQYADDLEGFKEMMKGAQIVFCLENPIIVQLTPQEFLALPGVNTFSSDTGDTTVTGKADPTAVIEKLTNAIIALGGNV